MMANGNADVLREMREIIRDGITVDSVTRDRLLFTSMISLSDRLDSMQIQFNGLQPMKLFYKVAVWFASGIGLSIVVLIGGILTGKVEVIFK
jgi:hypothetical protein